MVILVVLVLEAESSATVEALQGPRYLQVRLMVGLQGQRASDGSQSETCREKTEARKTRI